MPMKMNTKFTEMVPCSPGSRTFIVEAMHANERHAKNRATSGNSLNQARLTASRANPSATVMPI